MIKSVAYAATRPGPKLLVIGAVHGDEKCGTQAIRRVMAEIDEGRLALNAGRVTFVPIANPKAYEMDVRFVERNLNRYLVPMDKPDCYEAQLGNILCPLLADCDVLLDIHSVPIGGAASTFVGKTDIKAQEFAASLGYTMVTGWQEAYAATGRKKKQQDSDESTGTTEYCRRFGATALTLECGDHADPQAPEVAYHAIHNALRSLGLTKEAQSSAAPQAKPSLVTMTQVFYYDGEGSYAKPRRHLDPLVGGEVIATLPDGTAITAPADGYMIIPHADPKPGNEWFYFGV